MADLSNKATGYPHCFNEFFSRLTGSVNCGAGKWKSLCPAHPDVIQSLSVRVGARGQLYVRCHAGTGCPVDVVVKALRLEMDDLFPDNKRHTKREGKPKMAVTQTVYQYRDEAGILLFEAVRRDPKIFRQRQPNPDFDPGQPTDDQNPEYLYNLEGVRRVLYKLPQLISALERAPQKMVFVCEGERDVETAMGAGILATCNPMGAGKWLPEFAEHLNGCNVVVIADNDSPGTLHARAVAESLKAVARTVRVTIMPGAPEKGDFTEWWHRVGGTVEQKKDALKKLVNQLPIFGGTGGAVPVVAPTGTTAPTPDPVPAPAPPKDEKPMGKPTPTPAPVEAAPVEAAPAKPPAEVAAPRPVPVDVPPAPQPSAPKAAADSTHSDDPKVRAARVAAWLKDVKGSAAALKLAGCVVRSPVEFYGAVRIAVSELDAAMRLEGGVPKLDVDRMGQVSLLLGAYLITAAANFGLGVGLGADVAATAS